MEKQSNYFGESDQRAPTPDEIKRQCALFQKKWTKAMLRQRSGEFDGKTNWEPPITEPIFEK